MLWEREQNVVWVDTNQDRSFADEKPMTDYAHRLDIGVFGDSESTAPVRETIMFTVQTRPGQDAVAVNLGTSSHGTIIAGATFGSRGQHGRYDGIAPGAQIISVTPWPADSRASVATYFRLPRGLTALRIESSDSRVHVSGPDGDPFPFLLGAKDSWPHAGRMVRTRTDLGPGTWEAVVLDSLDGGVRQRLVEAGPSTVSLTISGYAVAVSAQTAEEFAPAPGTSTDLEVRLANRRAPFRGGLKSQTLGAARVTKRTIAAREIHTHPIDVPAGSDLLFANVAAAGETAELDVYLFDCTAENVHLVQRQVAVSPGGVLSVEQPAAGRWTVVVDAVGAPDGPVSYRYLDVVCNPRYGYLSSPDAPRTRDTGAEWSVRAHTWFAALPDSTAGLPAAPLVVTSDDVMKAIPQTRVDIDAGFGPGTFSDPVLDHAPLGWAVVLFDTDGPRVVTG